MSCLDRRLCQRILALPAEPSRLGADASATGGRPRLVSLPRRKIQVGCNNFTCKDEACGDVDGGRLSLHSSPPGVRTNFFKTSWAASARWVIEVRSVQWARAKQR